MSNLFAFTWNDHPPISLVRKDLLFQLCPRFQAYIAARRPQLAVRTKTQFYKTKGIVYLGHYWFIWCLGSHAKGVWSNLSVGIFYGGVIFLHKNALHELDCLEWTEETKFINTLNHSQNFILAGRSASVESESQFDRHIRYCEIQSPSQVVNNM